MLRATHTQRVEEMTRRVVEEVSSFGAAEDQSDDISVLALRWLGARRDEPHPAGWKQEASRAVLV
jgi:hypothetical protein